MADNRKGSGFVNLQRIIGANVGNRLGERVSSGIKTAAERAKSDVEDASSKFQQESEAASVAGQPIQSRLQKILNGSPTVPSDNKSKEPIFKPEADFGVGRDSLGHPTLVSVKTPEQQALEEQRNKNIQAYKSSNLSEEDISFGKEIAEGRGYKGPTGLENAAGISARAQSAEGLGQAARTAEGRSGLLSRFVGSPSYTSGQRNLDTILLGRTGAPQVREAAQATRGLTRQADEASMRAGNLAAQRQAEAVKLGQEFKGQVDKSRQDITQAGQTKADEFLAKEQAIKSDFEKALEFNPYLKEFFTYQPAAGLDFATGAAKDQALAASLSDEDKAKVNALARISGEAEPFSAEDFGVSQLQQGQVDLNVDGARKAYESYSSRVNQDNEAFNAQQAEKRKQALHELNLKIARDNALARTINSHEPFTPEKIAQAKAQIEAQYAPRQASPISYQDFINQQKDAYKNALTPVDNMLAGPKKIKV